MKRSELQQIIREEISKILKEEKIQIKLNVPGYRETIIISNEDDIKDFNKVWKGDKDEFGKDLYNTRTGQKHSAAMRIYNRSEKNNIS